MVRRWRVRLFPVEPLDDRLGDDLVASSAGQGKATHSRCSASVGSLHVGRCSGCGAVSTKLALSERTYTCTTCGLTLNRDLNAAYNLAALAANCDTAGSGPVAGRGANHKTPLAGQVAVKRQPGTAPADQTGTVPPQGGTTQQTLTRASER
ncbi:zinc ribbon domain-containing protein [Micromonospora musae]|uniref:zinc ribbon domain-containing protein n=1 Tax=Micromonospora musae TaxID=1894970 RepID=UPI003405797F